MKIAMLTGGGDCPGLNTALKGLAAGALALGWEVIGVRRGWQGLVEVDLDSPESRATWLRTLDAESIRTIDRTGGTFLHSSRTNPAAVKRGDGTVDLTPQILAKLEALQVAVLFPIGGDDTLSYGDRLHREGFPVIGIPKTMDNDVHGTDYCLGFATAVSRSVEYLHNLRTCAASHERFAVVECMGRNAGFTSLIPAYLASVDRALIAEVPFDGERLARLLSDDKRKNPSGYAMVTVSEGAIQTGGEVVQSGEADAYGHRKLGGIGERLAADLKARTGEGIVYQNLGYLVRAGRPDPFDVMVTFNWAKLAIALAQQRKFGSLVRLHQGVYGHAPMSIVSAGKKRVDVANMYDSENYRPKIRSVIGLPAYL